MRGCAPTPKAALEYAADECWTSWPDATSMSPQVTDSYCYDLTYDGTNDDEWFGVNIFFGGGGFHSDNCR